ncbi:tetratricopeptide repeat protein [Crocosphaera sp.]|uniref:tetratricopeptide repeat protein n=1 Tax=Crocosphaera sp. TaxID=2729996 RepID=UPI002606FC52|nr:tetratricopeptide repeat protein [Crocosphaera sp.]MDJ0581854.1 tetratricopeptide repeat protein [Crocosphaera sp.]
MLKLRLIIASLLCATGTFYPAILGSATATGVGVLSGIIANDLGSIWDKIGHRLQDNGLLHNHDLTKAVGVAIAAIIAKTAKDETKIDRVYRSHLESLAKYTENNWLNFCINDLNFSEKTEFNLLEDSQLTKLFLTSPDNFNAVRVFNINDLEADKKIWREEIIRKLVNKNDTLSSLQVTEKEKEEINQIIDVLSEALSQQFPQALRGVLKEDCGKGGKAYAGFSIDMFGVIQQAIQTSKDEIIVRLEKIENNLQNNTIASDNRELIEKLEAIYNQKFDNRDDLKNIIHQANRDINQDFTNINQQLEDLKANNNQEFIKLGNKIQSGFDNIEQLLNNLSDKVDKILKEVKGIKRIQEKQQENSTAIIITGGNAPKLISHWQGRKEEIERIKTCFSNAKTPLVGIDGVGGIGKSSLAGKLYEETREFAQKYWRDVTNGTLFTDIARDAIAAFGGTVPQQETLLVDGLIKCLQSGQYLLVIDNLESVLTTQREWKDRFYEQFFNTWVEYGKNSIVLVTTREQPLLKGIEWINLEGLQAEEGAKLLEELGITGELEDFSALVGGHPLMLRLVADLLKDEYPQDPDLRRLDSLGLGNLRQILTDERVKGQHRRETVGMVAVLSATVERLTEAQRELWCNLSVYRKPFDKVAANFISREDSETLVEAELRKLVKRSLLQEKLTEDTRYFEFQPVLQEYALYCGGDFSDAHKKAIAYYQSIAEDDPNSKETVQPYLEIFYHYCEIEEYETAFDVIAEVNELLKLRGLYSNQVECYSRLVKAWEKTAINNWKYSASLCDLGNASHFLGQYKQAITYYQQSLDIARSIGDRYREGNCFGNLGVAYYSLGEYKQAITYHQQSLDIARDMGDRQGEGYALGNLGVAYYSLGEYKQAINYYQQSLEIARDIGDHNVEGNCLGNLGVAYKSLGEYQESITYHQQSLDIARDIGDRRGEGGALGNLGVAYYDLGEYQQAITYHQQSLDIARDIGDRRGEGNSLGNVGLAYHDLGEYQQAITYHQQNLDIARDIGDRQGEGSALGNLGVAYYDLGEYQQAITYHQQSLDIARDIGDRRGEGGSLGNLGLAYNSLGQYQQAINYDQQSLDIARDIGDKRGEANACFNIAVAFTNVQRNDDAIEAFSNARKLYQDMGINNMVERCDNEINALESDVSSPQGFRGWFKGLWKWFKN